MVNTYKYSYNIHVHICILDLTLHILILTYSVIDSSFLQYIDIHMQVGWKGLDWMYYIYLFSLALLLIPHFLHMYAGDYDQRDEGDRKRGEERRGEGREQRKRKRAE